MIAKPLWNKVNSTKSFSVRFNVSDSRLTVLQRTDRVNREQDVGRCEMTKALTLTISTSLHDITNLEGFYYDQGRN